MKVLNAAIGGGGVGDDMIAAAQQALDEGFQGSLSRWVALSCHCLPHCDLPP